MITEIVLFSSPIAGDTHTIFQMYMHPVDFSLIGTVHSPPSGSIHSSELDKMLFRKYGKIHMIVAHPFHENSWMEYDTDDKEAIMQIVY